MSDPVADKSGFLKMYMSNHPDTLVAYAKWYGKVAEAVTSAEMSAIDSKVIFSWASPMTGANMNVSPLSEHDSHLYSEEWEQEAS
jgi:hypothetical protein